VSFEVSDNIPTQRQVVNKNFWKVPENLKTVAL